MSREERLPQLWWHFCVLSQQCDTVCNVRSREQRGVLNSNLGRGGVVVVIVVVIVIVIVVTIALEPHARAALWLSCTSSCQVTCYLVAGHICVSPLGSVLCIS